MWDQKEVRCSLKIQQLQVDEGKGWQEEIPTEAASTNVGESELQVRSDVYLSQTKDDLMSRTVCDIPAFYILPVSHNLKQCPASDWVTLQKVKGGCRQMLFSGCDLQTLTISFIILFLWLHCRRRREERKLRCCESQCTAALATATVIQKIKTAQENGSDLCRVQWKLR